MKTKDVRLGGRYLARVSDKIVTVRVLSSTERTRFNGTRGDHGIRFTAFNCRNEATGREIICSAARLRGPALVVIVTPATE